MVVGDWTTVETDLRVSNRERLEVHRSEIRSGAQTGTPKPGGTILR